MKRRRTNNKSQKRGSWLLLVIFLCQLAIVTKLYYWQIIKGKELKAQVVKQSERIITKFGQRGKIFTSDNKLLVSNKELFHLYVDKRNLEISNDELANRISEILVKKEAADNEIQSENENEVSLSQEELKTKLIEKLESQKKWLHLSSNIDPETKEQISEIKSNGLYLENYYSRHYPESSMAANITGFVGKNENGEDIGYFGIEGQLNKELEGKKRQIIAQTDAIGTKISSHQFSNDSLNGRDIVLTIRRDIQYLAETMLKQGIEKYGAAAGEIVIMETKTGKILALANEPKYDQARYSKYDNDLYRNPSVSSIYEPGSTFKVITMAAGIDLGVIDSTTICTRCSNSRTISGYTIKTYNEEYHPNITMEDALVKSDNIALIFAAEKVGSDNFKKYVEKFGIGEKIHIELQEDTESPLPKYWTPLKLATSSFGQGISTTSMQLVRAVNAIANGGKMIRPYLIDKIIDHQSNNEIVTETIVEEVSISEETAQKVTAMMIQSAHPVEKKKWGDNSYFVAGKTGTAQIPSKDGGYQEDSTIGSFIAFAPADDPEFTMLVKIVRPTATPWGSTTAGPLWFDVADQLLLHLNIQRETAS